MKHQILRYVLSAFAAGIFSFTQMISVRAAPSGSLDTTFGNNGKVTLFSSTLADWLQANATAVQSDGKILVAGSVQSPAFSTAYTTDFFVARFNANGSPDTSFGSSGVVSVNFYGLTVLPPERLSEDFANAMVVQPDGKIVVAGFTAGSSLNGNRPEFALIRLNTDGSLDTTFDGDGRVTTSVGPNYAPNIYSIALQPDGKIVVGGTVNSDFAVARYDRYGTLDTSFGVNGFRLINIDGGLSTDQARSVMIRSNGRIVLAGGSDSDFAVVRLDANGLNLDPDFGTGGIVVTSIRASDTLLSAVQQSNGDIVAAGCSDGDFALVRYDRNGFIDPTFNRGGVALTDISGNDCARAVKVQSDGRILAAGNNGNGDFALVRYEFDGRLDRTWGGGTVVTTDFGATDTANALAIQPDGKIIAVGNFASNSGSFAAALARYMQ